MALFVLVLESGEEVLTCMSDDGRTWKMMSAEDTAAQLERMKR
jgi:hypothetical protein